MGRKYGVINNLVFALALLLALIIGYSLVKRAVIPRAPNAILDGGGSDGVGSQEPPTPQRLPPLHRGVSELPPLKANPPPRRLSPDRSDVPAPSR